MVLLLGMETAKSYNTIIRQKRMKYNHKKAVILIEMTTGHICAIAH